MVGRGGSHSGREIARRVDLDPKTCHVILRDLLAHGILDRRKVGAAYLYTLREEHVLITRVLRPAFEVEETLLADYAKELREGMQTRILSLLLFGSTARQEETATSDVDLLAIVSSVEEVELAEEEAAEQASDLAGKYGNSPQLVVYHLDGFREASEGGDPFVREVLRTGRVVHGLSLTKLLARGS